LIHRVFAVALLSTVASMTVPTALSAQAAQAPALAYPQAKKVDVVDTQFGVAVADPYRWLENDVRNDKEVEAWVTAQKPGHRRLPAEASAARLVQAAHDSALRL
jgi:prolyl oligopeptidase